MSMVPSFFGGGVDQSAQTVEIEGLVANENLLVGHIVRTISDGADGIIAKADNSTNHVIGVCTAGSTAGGKIEIAQSGLTSVLMDSTPASSDNGKIVFLNGNGQGTLTAPTASGRYVIKVGFVVGANGSANPVDMLLRIETVVRLG